MKLKINKDEKVLVFSDTHIGKKDETEKLNFLQTLINSYDVIVINGDLWSDYEISFQKFCESSWKSILDLLQTKKTFYIAGNHDPLEKILEAGENFCQEVLEELTLLTESGNEIYIKHGQTDTIVSKLATFFVKKWPAVFNKILTPFGLMLTLHMNLRKWRVSRIDTLKNKVYKRHHYKKRNNILVMGHTHAPEFDLKKRYINTGFINKGFASYLEIVDGELNFVETRY